MCGQVAAHARAARRCVRAPGCAVPAAAGADLLLCEVCFRLAGTPPSNPNQPCCFRFGVFGLSGHRCTCTRVFELSPVRLWRRLCCPYTPHSTSPKSPHSAGHTGWDCKSQSANVSYHNGRVPVCRWGSTLQNRECTTLRRHMQRWCHVCHGSSAAHAAASKGNSSSRNCSKGSTLYPLRQVGRRACCASHTRAHHTHSCPSRNRRQTGLSQPSLNRRQLSKVPREPLRRLCRDGFQRPRLWEQVGRTVDDADLHLGGA